MFLMPDLNVPLLTKSAIIDYRIISMVYVYKGLSTANYNVLIIISNKSVSYHDLFSLLNFFFPLYNLKIVKINDSKVLLRRIDIDIVILCC